MSTVHTRSTCFGQRTLQFPKHKTVMYTKSFHTLSIRLMNSIEQIIENKKIKKTLKRKIVVKKRVKHIIYVLLVSKNKSVFIFIFLSLETMHCCISEMFVLKFCTRVLGLSWKKSGPSGLIQGRQINKQIVKKRSRTAGQTITDISVTQREYSSTHAKVEFIIVTWNTPVSQLFVQIIQ